MTTTEGSSWHDEAPLVRAVQDGDTAAFGPLVDAHLDALRAFIALKLPVPHLIDEIAHEAFVFAFRRIGDFEAGTSFRSWLRAIAANLIRAELQRFAREQAGQLNYARAQALEGGLTPDADPAEMEFLQECIQEVPPNLRELLDLKYRDDLSIETIAGRLSRTENAVWQALFRLRQQLRLCIESKLARSRP
jgi:RNA polymerase sigma-70 factor (ECF subfamily)